MSEHEGRQTGTTTRQMRDAPQAAMFIWPNDATYYARSLARHLGREDLKVVSVNDAERVMIGWRHAVIVDHAAYLSSHLYAMVEYVNTRAPLRSAR